MFRHNDEWKYKTVQTVKVQKLEAELQPSDRPPAPGLQEVDFVLNFYQGETFRSTLVNCSSLEKY